MPAKRQENLIHNGAGRETKKAPLNSNDPVTITTHKMSFA